MTIAGMGNHYFDSYQLGSARRIEDFKSFMDTDLTAGEAEVTAGEEQVTRGSSLNRLLNRIQAPYSYLADENGEIHYNGVTFSCVGKDNALCLGDMGDEKNIINIPLSKGGVLKVNRNNLGDLADAIGMFSPEDVNRILRALTQDAKVQQTQQEIEDEINNTAKSAGEKSQEKEREQV